MPFPLQIEHQKDDFPKRWHRLPERVFSFPSFPTPSVQSKCAIRTSISSLHTKHPPAKNPPMGTTLRLAVLKVETTGVVSPGSYRPLTSHSRKSPKILFPPTLGSCFRKHFATRCSPGRPIQPSTGLPPRIGSHQPSRNSNNFLRLVVFFSLLPYIFPPNHLDVPDGFLDVFRLAARRWPHTFNARGFMDHLTHAIAEAFEEWKGSVSF